MKSFKKILTVVLVIAMTVSALALTSCKKDKNNDDKTNNSGNNTTVTDNTYTVTVVDGDNNPVAGVQIMISTTFDTLTTDANGKITFESENGGSVMIMSVPAGYKDPKSEEISFATGSKSLTLTVEKKTSSKVTYTVTIKDQNGDAVVGANVQMCPNGTCMAAVPTNANGEATNQIDSGSTVSVLLELPAGYTAPAANSNGYHAVIEAGETSIVITVTKN